MDCDFDSFEPALTRMRTPLEMLVALGYRRLGRCPTCDLELVVATCWTRVKCPCAQILDLAVVAPPQDVVS